MYTSLLFCFFCTPHIISSHLPNSFLLFFLVMGMHFLERWLICVERFTNADFLTAEGDPPGSGVFDDITRYPNFKVDNFLQHTHWRFLSVLRTMFSTSPAQTISMIAPKAQECLVTIMLHMAHRAKKTKSQGQAPLLKRLREATSNLSATSAGTTSTTTTNSAMATSAGPPPPSTPNANALEAALQSAAGFMNASRLGTSTSSEQLMAAMEAAMAASGGAATVASTLASLASSQVPSAETTATTASGGTSGTRSPIPAPVTTTSDNNSESATVPVSSASGTGGAAAAPAATIAASSTSTGQTRAPSGAVSDNLAHLLDMFPSVPRELVMSALVECHGDLQVSYDER